MSATCIDPIAQNWTTQDPVVAGAADLAAVLAPLDPTALAPWHRRLAQAVDELHRAAGGTLTWDEREPIVALLRAVARLARTAPHASSAAAASLASDLAGAQWATRPPGRHRPGADGWRRGVLGVDPPRRDDR